MQSLILFIKLLFNSKNFSKNGYSLLKNFRNSKKTNWVYLKFSRGKSKRIKIVYIDKLLVEL